MSIIIFRAIRIFFSSTYCIDFDKKKKLYLIGTLRSTDLKILRIFLNNQEKQKQKLMKNANFYTKQVLIKFYWYNTKMNNFRKLKFSINMYNIIFYRLYNFQYFVSFNLSIYNYIFFFFFCQSNSLTI